MDSPLKALKAKGDLAGLNFSATRTARQLIAEHIRRALQDDPDALVRVAHAEGRLTDAQLARVEREIGKLLARLDEGAPA